MSRHRLMSAFTPGENGTTITSCRAVVEAALAELCAWLCHRAESAPRPFITKQMRRTESWRPHAE